MARSASPYTSSPDELIELARQALRHGHKDQARHYLNQAAQIDGDNFMIWLWLASVAPDPKTSLGHVQRAERLNPNDPRVYEARQWVEKRLQATPSKPLPPAEPIEVNRQKGKVPTAVLVGSLVIVFIMIAALAAALLSLNQNNTVVKQTRPVVNEGIAIIPTTQIKPERADANNLPVETTNTPKPFIPAKDISAQSGAQARPTWTITPTPTDTPTPTPTWVPTFVSNGGKEYLTRPFGIEADEKWIDVDLSQQTLTAYIGNDAVFSTYISSGDYEHPTVTGQFRIWITYESQTMDGRLLGYDYYLEDVPYVMYFYHDYALHGTYWHNNFGTPMSHGCVNLSTADAGWIYNWASLGTLVNVHN